MGGVPCQPTLWQQPAPTWTGQGCPARPCCRACPRRWAPSTTTPAACRASTSVRGPTLSRMRMATSGSTRPAPKWSCPSAGMEVGRLTCCDAGSNAPHRQKTHALYVNIKWHGWLMSRLGCLFVIHTLPSHAFCSVLLSLFSNPIFPFPHPQPPLHFSISPSCVGLCHRKLMHSGESHS